MLADKRLELVDQRRAGAEREIGFDPLFERTEAEFLQPCTLLLQEAAVGDVGKWRTAPERQRLAQLRHRERRVADGKRTAPLVRQPLESVEVDFVRLNPQAVAGRLCNETLVRASADCE